MRGPKYLNDVYFLRKAAPSFAGINSKKMNLTHAKVLITGGSDGIGYGLATLFLEAGSQVLITGRNADKLALVAQQHPGLVTLQNDIGNAIQRQQLADFVQQHLPGINILINNAGIQRRVALAEDHATWPERQQEIDILFSAPVHLNHLLLPLLLQNGPARIVNVSSGGAFIPQVFAPVYSACKAALHSYTITLRHALQHTAVKVVELVPPAVQTGLAGPGQAHGADLSDFCKTVFPLLVAGETAEVGYGPTAQLAVTVAGRPLPALFAASAARFGVALYNP